MQLDIVIPSFNRRDLLQKTIESVLAATIPRGCEVCVYAVDNKCTDGTAEMIRVYARTHPGRVQYVSELVPGRSSALNAGILASSGDIVAFLDDDEEVFNDWIVALEREFRDPTVGFIGGPVIPRYEGALPKWLPSGFPAVIGEVTGPTCVVPYGSGFEGILMGGNAAVRRDLLAKVGLLNTALGRSGNKRLMSGEDRDFYERLLAAGGTGNWIPDFRILHFLPPSRLTKAYHRRWAFDHGASVAIHDMRDSDSAKPIPRWRYGVLVREFGRMLNVLQKESNRFTSELRFREALGYILERRAGGPSSAPGVSAKS